MANRMVGRELNRIFPAKSKRERSGIPALSIENLSHAGRVRNVSLELFKGEILGLAGLGGAGRTELAENRLRDPRKNRRSDSNQRGSTRHPFSVGGGIRAGSHI